MKILNVFSFDAESLPSPNGFKCRSSLLMSTLILKPEDEVKGHEKDTVEWRRVVVYEGRATLRVGGRRDRKEWASKRRLSV